MLALESRVSRATLRCIHDSYSVYMYTKGACHAPVTGPPQNAYSNADIK